MVTGGIYREQTPEEKKNYLDLRYNKSENVKQKKMAEISEFEHKTIYKDRKPFCSPCAIAAVNKRFIDIQEKIKKARRMKDDKVEIDIKIDWREFCADVRFEEVDSEEVQEEKIIDGFKQKVQTGMYKNFICKICGSKHSMEFKSRELDASNHIPDSMRSDSVVNNPGAVADKNKIVGAPAVKPAPPPPPPATK